MQLLLLCYSAAGFAMLQGSAATHIWLTVLCCAVLCCAVLCYAVLFPEWAHCGQALETCLLWLLQMTIIDAEAMLIALAACLVPPLIQLNRHKSEDRVSRPATLVLLFVMVAGLEVADIVIIIYMTTQPWYTGGTGSATNVSFCCCDTLKCKMSMARLVQSLSGAVEL